MSRAYKEDVATAGGGKGFSFTPRGVDGIYLWDLSFVVWRGGC